MSFSSFFSKEESKALSDKGVNFAYSSSVENQDFSSDEDDSIDVSVVFLGKPKDSALIIQYEDESPARLIGKNQNGFYWVSPVRPTAKNTKKDEGTDSWKSECNCAIL